MVTLRGLQIGEVSSVDLWYDKAADRVVVAVRFDIEPQRISQLQLPGGSDLIGTLRVLVHRGLRASLGTSNLLTGQKEVALGIQPDAPAADLSTDGKLFVLPTTRYRRTERSGAIRQRDPGQARTTCRSNRSART